MNIVTPQHAPLPDSGNGHIRQMLHSLGMRSSLLRLKLIAQILKAPHETGIGTEPLHGAIEADLNTALSPMNTRDVLRRLQQAGVIARLSTGNYAITPQAAEQLGHLQHPVDM